MMNKQDHCVSYIMEGWPNASETQNAPPDYLSVTAKSPTTVRLQWGAIPYTSDGGYYEISYATNSFGPYSVHGVTTDKGEYQYVVDGLSPNTTYYFRIRTYTPAHDPYFQRNDLWSDYSAVVTARTPNLNPVPLTEVLYLPHLQHPGPGPGPHPTPGTTTIYAIDSNDCDGNYLFRWLPVAGATNYLVEETTTDPFGGVITAYDGPNTFVSIENRTPETYRYRVQARNSSGSSIWSEVVEIRVCANGMQSTALAQHDEQDTLMLFSALSERQLSPEESPEAIEASEFGEGNHDELSFASSGFESDFEMDGKERYYYYSPLPENDFAWEAGRPLADGPWKGECPQEPLTPEQWRIWPPNYLEQCLLAPIMRR